MKKRIVGLLLVVAMVVTLIPSTAFAKAAKSKEEPKYTRTVLLYLCGSNLESNSGDATWNLEQAMSANFSQDEKVKFVVLTGGAEEWQTSSERLVIDPSLEPSGEATDKISGNYNQVWELNGADATENPGKMILKDGDGITKDTPVKNTDELMSDPKTLRAFINYGVKNYPSEKFDLILWDHGGGPHGGFGVDEHSDEEFISMEELVDAIGNNNLTNPSDPEEAKKFDFIDFDACLMNSLEINLMLGDYMDYYIASPETEPGKGQEYSGWLNKLGENPNIDGYTLGKKIVDDFIAFYEDEKYLDKGTLAVVDVDKFIKSGIVSALSDLNEVLADQARQKLFYDEISSCINAIEYQGTDYIDLGNLSGLLSVVNSEITDKDLEDDYIKTTNAYSDAKIEKKIGEVLENTSIIYARGTKDIRKEGQIYRKTDGEISFDDLKTSGMYIYFVKPENQMETSKYINAISPAIEKMRNKTDGRYQFLSDYMQTMIDYSLIWKCGKTVSSMINEYNVKKSQINYDSVKKEWMTNRIDPTDVKSAEWFEFVKILIDKRRGGEAGAKEWLDSVVKHQADEAIMMENITPKQLKEKEGIGYQINIKDTRKRVVQLVGRNIRLEIPAVEKYLKANFDPSKVKNILADSALSMGYETGSMDYQSGMPEEATVEDRIRWYNEKEATWNVHAAKEEWYAINDASGKLHAIAINEEIDDEITIIGVTSEYGKKWNSKMETVKMLFDKKSKKLTNIVFNTPIGERTINPKDLKGTLNIMPALDYEIFDEGTVHVPTSDTRFILSADTAKKITLDKVAMGSITDIRDTDGDGTVLDSCIIIKDMYDNTLDISELAKKQTEEVVDIDMAQITHKEYEEGKHQTVEVTYRGKALEEGVDYTWKSVETGNEFEESGEYLIVLYGKGKFVGTALKSFYIYISEEKIEEMLLDSFVEIKTAKEKLDAAIESGSDDEIKAAYDALVNAQGNMITVMTDYNITKAALSETKIGNLEDRLADVQDELKSLINKYNDLVEENENHKKIIIELKGIINTKAPKKAVIKSLKVGKKKMTVKMKYSLKKLDGTKYQLSYKVKGKKKWKTKYGTKTKFVIKKLKKGKKYIVRARAIKVTKYKSYYGKWSKKKTSKKIKK